MSEIYKNEGGFRLVTAAVPRPTVKHSGDLVFDINLNLVPKDRLSNYAVDVYYNDRFVMRTNEYPIVIRNEDLIRRYNIYERMKFTFVTHRIKGNKQAGASEVLYIQKTLCSNNIYCSETTICGDGKSQITEGDN